MFGEYKNIKIAGMSAVAPKETIDNIELVEKFGVRRAKKQVQLTGVNRRHVCEKGQTISALAYLAADRLLKQLQWDKDDIKVIVYITQSPDVATPATAMIIQKYLKIGTNCLAFDVNLGCTGYVSGLQIISGILNNVKGKGLLLTGDGGYRGEMTAYTTDSLLFGDGASATAIEYEEGEKGFKYSQYSDGSRYELLTRSFSGEIHMDGNAILLFSLGEVVESIKEFKKYFLIKENNIDYYVFHQAQKLILDGMADGCGIGNDKMLISYDEFGNTSSATIPLTICHNVDRIKIKENVNLLLSGFGVGLAWSNVYISINTKNIISADLSDYKFY